MPTEQHLTTLFKTYRKHELSCAIEHLISCIQFDNELDEYGMSYSEDNAAVMIRRALSILETLKENYG